MRFLIADGKVVEKEKFHFYEELTGSQPGLNQEMWYGYGGIPLFNENISLLKVQAESLKMTFPEEFQNTRELFRLVKRMLNKNKYYRSGHVLFQLFTGKSSIHTLVTSTAFTDFTFPFSEEGLLMRFSTLKKYSFNKLNRLSFFNERLWQASLAEIHDPQVTQSVILNENDYVCECAFANLFMMVGNELATPSVESGSCVKALRPLLMEAAARIGLKVTEKAFISKEYLLNADELFCASESSGIQWVLGIENQRFIHYFSQRINEELNTLLKIKAASHPL